jgi:mRNA interferase RelE/StbE
MAYGVLIKSSALKALGRLPRADQARVASRIDSLAAQPRPQGAVKLAGTEDVYRVRAGDYRIIYEVCDRILRVLVIRIGHRREVYRRRS